MAALDVNLSEAEFERWLAAASAAIPGPARSQSSGTRNRRLETRTSHAGTQRLADSSARQGAPRFGMTVVALFSDPGSGKKTEEGDGA